MKYILIAFVPTIILANLIFQCPTEVGQKCSTLEYNPVCAYNKLYIKNTYRNKCLACFKESENSMFNNVEYYEGPCQAGFSFIEIFQNVTTYLSKSFYYNIHYKSGLVIDCSYEEYFVCGFSNCQYNDTSSCYKTQKNSCVDMNEHDILYFVGKCENYPKEIPKLLENLKEYKVCQKQENIDYLQDYFQNHPKAYSSEINEFPYFSQQCSDRLQDCDIFRNQTCEEYKQGYQILPNYQIKRVNNENSTTLFYIELECWIPRPYNCDNSINEVCATYQCGDTTCRKEYQNECFACMNPDTISYFKDKCVQISIKEDQKLEQSSQQQENTQLQNNTQSSQNITQPSQNHTQSSQNNTQSSQNNTQQSQNYTESSQNYTQSSQNNTQSSENNIQTSQNQTQSSQNNTQSLQKPEQEFTIAQNLILLTSLIIVLLFV